MVLLTLETGPLWTRQNRGKRPSCRAEYGLWIPNCGAIVGFWPCIGEQDLGYESEGRRGILSFTRKAFDLVGSGSKRFRFASFGDVSSPNSHTNTSFLCGKPEGRRGWEVLAMLLVQLMSSPSLVLGRSRLVDAREEQD